MPSAIPDPSIPAAGRSRSALLRMLDFSPVAYRALYPDLAHLDDRQAVEHFGDHGWAEGRDPAFALAPGEARDRLDWLALAPADRDKLMRMLVLSHLRQRDMSAFDGDEVGALVRNAGGLQPVLIFGDSHARFFSVVRPFLDDGLLPITCLCSGGSARGLGNPNARAGYGARILATLATLADGPMPLIVFKFGQVDIEFVYNFKRVESGETAFDLRHCLHYLEDTARAYVAFVARIARPGVRVAVMSVFPPTLKDAVLREGYVNAHIGFLHSEAVLEELSRGMQALDLPDLATRTGIHRRFNDALARLCADHGIAFVAEHDAMLGPDGLVAEPFVRGHGGTDHHLSLESDEAIARVAAVAGAFDRLARTDA